MLRESALQQNRFVHPVHVTPVERAQLGNSRACPEGELDEVASLALGGLENAFTLRSSERIDLVLLRLGVSLAAHLLPGQWVRVGQLVLYGLIKSVAQNR